MRNIQDVSYFIQNNTLEGPYNEWDIVVDENP